MLRRPSDGQLTQLDFGPVGGDIAFAPKAPKQGFWAWAATAAGRKPIAPHGTPAEVREQPVSTSACDSRYMTHHEELTAIIIEES